MIDLKAMSAAAMLGAAVLAGPAMAGEPITLDATQLDQVAAGALTIRVVNNQTYFIWERSFNIPTGTLTYTSPVRVYDHWAYGFVIAPVT